MSKYFYCIFILIIFNSCSKSLEFKPKKIKYVTSKNCNQKKDCGKAQFNILYTDNQSRISDSVNKNLINIIKDNLFDDDGFDTIQSYKGISNVFLNDYYKEKSKSENNSISSYELSVSNILGYQSEKLINLHVYFKKDSNEIDDYFGILSLLIEKETGRKIPCHKLFKDKDLVNVLEISEMAFRERYKIEYGESYNKNGFFFKNNKFELPENIFLVKEGILFIYNPYEISTLSKGNIAFEISYKEIAKYMAIR
jgi:hypothetical protein